MKLARLAGGVFVAAALYGCSALPVRGTRATTVVAEGWAPEGPQARVAALAEAQKRAVEQAAGVKVAATTTVDGAVATRRRIKAAASGRVQSFTELGTRTEGGFVKTRIRAVVMILAEPEIPVDAKVSVDGTGPAVDALRRAMAARGFSVVDSGAEYSARAKAGARSVREPRVAPFSARRARVDIELREVATGAVVWTGSREAAALGGDPLEAAGDAAAGAGDLAAADAAAGLAAYLWNK